MNGEKKKTKYGTVSISIGLLEDIDKLIEKFHYWPSRSAFVREACIEKIRREEDRLKELSSERQPTHSSAQSKE